MQLLPVSYKHIVHAYEAHGCVHKQVMQACVNIRRIYKAQYA